MREPKLYIMMRNDLVDLTPGKAMAQAAHAANKFTYNLENKLIIPNLKKQFNAWQGKTPQRGLDHTHTGFGTTIILSATKEQLESVIPVAISEGYECDFIFDPSYPIRSAAGETFHVNAMTCGYIFAGPYTENYDTEILLREMKLY